MPKSVDPEDRKMNITIKIKKKNIDRIKKIKGYNAILDILIEDYLKKNEQ